MNAVASELREIVAMFDRQCAPRPSTATAGWKYGSTYDLVLREGREWAVQDSLPERYECLRGELGDCFRTCTQAVIFPDRSDLADELTYVEGYAFSKFPLPIHHAWLVDREGLVVEPTWLEVGQAYFGIPFTPTALSRGVLRSKTYGLLDDWARDYPYERLGLEGEA